MRVQLSRQYLRQVLRNSLIILLCTGCVSVRTQSKSIIVRSGLNLELLPKPFIKSGTDIVLIKQDRVVISINKNGIVAVTAENLSGETQYNDKGIIKETSIGRLNYPVSCSQNNENKLIIGK